MSCHGEQGTANPTAKWPFDDDGSNAATSGFLQVMPEDFTRTELCKLRDRVQDLLRFGLLSDAKHEYLECMEEDLDVLDALAARDELDAIELNGEVLLDIREHMGSGDVHLSPLPSCSSDCPFHSRIRT